MTTTTERAKIVVSIDTTAYAAPAIALAASLARARQRALHGLIIEDEELLCVARLPFSHEVLNAGGQVRKLSGPALERQMTRVASDLRAAVENHAQQFSLTWSCSTVRGKRRQITLAEGSRAEILVVAQPAHSLRVAAPQHKLLLLNWDKPAVLRMLASVLEVASPQAMTLLLPGNHDESALTDLLTNYSNVFIRRMGDIAPAELFKSPRLRPALTLVARDCEPSTLSACLQLAHSPVLIAS